MTLYVELDFETKSLCDLKLAGAWRYAEDTSTEVICIVYSLEGELWPWCPDDPVEPLYSVANNQEICFVAHNAQFEQAIWHHHMVARYGFPPIPVSRWDCTLAACAWKGYPLALGKAARAFKLDIEKDKEGNKLTLSLSKPDKKTGNLPDISPVIRQRVIQYCQQDVIVEHGIRNRISLISQQSKNERKIWQLDQTINQRGVRLDMEFVEAAQVVVDRASAPLRDEFTALTGLIKVASPRLLEWCAQNGLKLDNLQKQTLAKVLEIDEDDPDPTYGYESWASEEDAGECLALQHRGLQISDGCCKSDRCSVLHPLKSSSECKPASGMTAELEDYYSIMRRILADGVVVSYNPRIFQEKALRDCHLMRLSQLYSAVNQEWSKEYPGCPRWRRLLDHSDTLWSLILARSLWLGTTNQLRQSLSWHLLGITI